jgi:hypothetical protein
MTFLVQHPIVWFLVVIVLLYFASRLGEFVQKHRSARVMIEEKEFDLVVGATLTLLGLIIGFTFSMAVTRYDQRKNLEEAEANAIGTEYVRADLLPSGDAAKVRALLRDYTDQRILYYTSRDNGRLQQINGNIAQLQSNLWSSVTSAGTTRDPVTALVLSGMNDVLNSQGYTEAASRNRVPLAAWVLLIMIAFFCNLLLGLRGQQHSSHLLWILPIALAVSFFLIADIDSPRHGVIRVVPQNLESLADSIRAH